MNFLSQLKVMLEFQVEKYFQEQKIIETMITKNCDAIFHSIIWAKLKGSHLVADGVKNWNWRQGYGGERGVADNGEGNRRKQRKKAEDWLLYRAEV